MGFFSKVFKSVKKIGGISKLAGKGTKKIAKSVPTGGFIGKIRKILQARKTAGKGGIKKKAPYQGPKPGTRNSRLSKRSKRIQGRSETARKEGNIKKADRLQRRSKRVAGRMTMKTTKPPGYLDKWTRKR